MLAEPALEARAHRLRRPGLEKGIAEPMLAPSACSEQGRGHRFVARDVGDIGLDRRLGERRMRIGVVAEVHPGIEPRLEQGDPRGAVGGIELDLVDEARRLPVVALHSREQAVGDVLALGRGPETAIDGQIVDGDRDPRGVERRCRRGHQRGDREASAARTRPESAQGGKYARETRFDHADPATAGKITPYRGRSAWQRLRMWRRRQAKQAPAK